MKRILILYLFFLLPALCLAEEKVYTNADIKSPPNYSKSTNTYSPQPQRQDLSNNRGRIISRGVFEQRDPAFQPQYEINPHVPQLQDATSSRADMNKTQPEALDQIKSLPMPPRNAFEQQLAEACTHVTLLMIIVIGIPFLIWLVCLIDVLRHDFTGNNKIIWFLVVCFLPVIGCVLYFFIGTDQKLRQEDDDVPMTRLI